MVSAILGRCADDQITVLSQVKRCDEMARKIRYFHEQVSIMLVYSMFCRLTASDSSDHSTAAVLGGILGLGYPSTLAGVKEPVPVFAAVENTSL